MTEEKLRELNHAEAKLVQARLDLARISNANLDPIPKSDWVSRVFPMNPATGYGVGEIKFSLHINDIYPIYLQEHRKAQIKYQEAKEKFESL